MGTTKILKLRNTAGNVQARADGPSLGDGQRSTGLDANNKSMLAGAAASLSRDIDTQPAFKTCETCQHSKPVVDFYGSTTSKDGRSDSCRACLASFKAKRGKKELHHLGLSVDEAWVLAKPCTKCGLVKELRDFSRAAASKSQVTKFCRACISSLDARRPRHVPSDQPQRCRTCLEVKAADQFYSDPLQHNGRALVCKPCRLKYRSELRHKIKEARVYITKEKKMCTGCRKEKPSSEFNVDRQTMDGLFYHCMHCLKARHKKTYISVRKQNGEQKEPEPSQEQ